MPRSSSGYYRAGRSLRADLTRRGVLGAAAVVAGAGIADLLHKPGRRAANRAATQPADAVGRRTPTSANESGVVTSSTQPASSHSAPPTVPTSGHAHHSSTDRRSSHGHHDSGHGHDIMHGRRRHEHVTLPAPTVRERSQPVYYVDQLIHDAPKHAIALTVDDGPDPEYTPKVLRLLDKYRMQASFCVVGVHADAYPRLIRDIHRAGHVIVNHSYTHVQPFNRQTEKRVVDEITKTQRAIEKATKVTPQLFRAPGGDWSPFIFRAAAAYGLTPLDWDVDPLDWETPGTKRIVRAMLRGRPNDIVLCHDGGGDRIETVRALRKVLPTWKHRGYATVSLVVPDSVKLPPRRQPTTPTASPNATPTPSVQPSGSATP